jgi:5-oxoprolinase (ATP-hydrolysing)
MTRGWRFWIDRGGTFTDIVAQRPDGRLLVSKLLSDGSSRYADAAVQGIREHLGILDGPIPPELIAEVKMGTTVATNALLERKGERTLLAITRGFGDALRIGYQNRPKLFERRIVLPTPLYERVVEIDERVSATGEVLSAPDSAAIRSALVAVWQTGIRSVAIVCMHGYRFPAHEIQIAGIARELKFTQVSTSHETVALMKLIGRGETTVVDAYLSPILRRHVDQVRQALGPHVRLSFIQSSGGLIDAAGFRGKDSILSGPAGGIVGMARTAAAAGFDRVIGFDMGGTSTDVSHHAGIYERNLEACIAGVRLRAPMLNIHTVAAGGGSVCRFDGSRFRVGPESAGANPGPACYGRGGPLTITDCNVLTGKLQADLFPAVFGVDGDAPLDIEAVRLRFMALAEDVAAATGKRLDPLHIAEGFLAIAVDNMAAAIKQVSVARGYDVARYTLACFGGAGGQHACLVADALGIECIMIHPLAGVLSAYGIGLADAHLVKLAMIEAPLESALLPRLEARIDEMSRAGRAELAAQGGIGEALRIESRVHIKYRGSDTALEVGYGGIGAMAADFEAAYRNRFAFTMPHSPLVVESLVVELIVPSAATTELPPAVSPRTGGADTHRHGIHGGRCACRPVLRSRRLAGRSAPGGPRGDRRCVRDHRGGTRVDRGTQRAG